MLVIGGLGRRKQISGSELYPCLRCWNSVRRDKKDDDLHTRYASRARGLGHTAVAIANHVVKCTITKNNVQERLLLASRALKHTTWVAVRRPRGPE
jgi:hypothetical protein